MLNRIDFYLSVDEQSVPDRFCFASCTSSDAKVVKEGNADPSPRPPQLSRLQRCADAGRGRNAGLKEQMRKNIW